MSVRGSTGPRPARTAWLAFENHGDRFPTPAVPPVSYLSTTMTPVKVFRDRSGNWHGQIGNPDGTLALAFAPLDLDDAVRTAEDFMGRELEWAVAPTGTIEAR